MSRQNSGDPSDRTAGLGDVSDRTANLGDRSDRTAGFGDVGDRTADLGDLSDRTAGVNILSNSTGSKSLELYDAMQSHDQRKDLLYNPYPSDKNDWVETHINRAEVISRYGDAIKKFDWLVYLIACFVLLMLCPLTYYFLGTGPAITHLCTAAIGVAIALIRKKSG